MSFFKFCLVFSVCVWEGVGCGREEVGCWWVFVSLYWEGLSEFLYWWSFSFVFRCDSIEFWLRGCFVLGEFF